MSPIAAGNVNTTWNPLAVYLWGAQIEVGEAPSSYIPTTTATVARAADSLVIGPDTFPVQEADECTVYWRGRIRGLRSSGQAGLLTASDGTSDEVVSIREGSSGADVVVTEGGSGVADTASQAITLGSDYALAASVRHNDLAFHANGAPVATDASLTLPAIDQLAIAPGAGSIYEIDEIAYIARARTAEELSNLTAM